MRQEWEKASNLLQTDDRTLRHHKNTSALKIVTLRLTWGIELRSYFNARNWLMARRQERWQTSLLSCAARAHLRSPASHLTLEEFVPASELRLRDKVFRRAKSPAAIRKVPHAGQNCISASTAKFVSSKALLTKFMQVGKAGSTLRKQTSTASGGKTTRRVFCLRCTEKKEIKDSGLQLSQITDQ
jgi:hypothetical protein